MGELMSDERYKQLKEAFDFALAEVVTYYNARLDEAEKLTKRMQLRLESANSRATMAEARQAAHAALFQKEPS